MERKGEKKKIRGGGRGGTAGSTSVSKETSKIFYYAHKFYHSINSSKLHDCCKIFAKTSVVK